MHQRNVLVRLIYFTDRLQSRRELGRSEERTAVGNPVQRISFLETRQCPTMLIVGAFAVTGVSYKAMPPRRAGELHPPTLKLRVFLFCLGLLVLS